MMSTRFVRCQRCVDYAHTLPHRIEKCHLYSALNKPQETHRAGRGPTETTADNGVGRVGGGGRELGEILVHFPPDPEKNPKTMETVRMLHPQLIM